MAIKEIVNDSLKYPLSDWKKILILGIIIFATGITQNFEYWGVTNVADIWLLSIVGFILGFLVNGYVFRVLKHSLDNFSELPKFDKWGIMLQDGAKVFLVALVYILPVILLMLYLIAASSEIVIFGSIESNPFILNLIQNFIQSSIGHFFVNSIGHLYSISVNMPIMPYEFAFGTEITIIYSIIGIMYLIVITPLFLMALANMADYEGDLISAFHFSEILEEIKYIGWVKLIKWYLVVFSIFTVLFFAVPTLIETILIQFDMKLVDFGMLGLFSLIIFSYLYIFIARAVALIYISE